jgi:DNA repair protein RadC
VARLPPSARPARESSLPGTLGDRIAQDGAGALSDLELLALVVGHGTPGGRVWKLVQALSARADLSELALLHCAGWLETSGVRPAEAALLSACFELGRRLYRPDGGARTLAQAADVHAVARDLELARKEHFVAFYLDARNRVLARETISVGSLSASIVHPREVFAPALERRAASIIIVHNHPSGDPEPSDDDLALTRRLVEVGLLLGIEVLDHLVIGHGIYVSLKSRGLM